MPSPGVAASERGWAGNSYVMKLTAPKSPSPTEVTGMTRTTKFVPGSKPVMRYDVEEAGTRSSITVPATAVESDDATKRIR